MLCACAATAAARPSTNGSARRQPWRRASGFAGTGNGKDVRLIVGHHVFVKRHDLTLAFSRANGGSARLLSPRQRKRQHTPGSCTRRQCRQVQARAARTSRGSSPQACGRSRPCGSSRRSRLGAACRRCASYTTPPAVGTAVWVLRCVAGLLCGWCVLRRCERCVLLCVASRDVLLSCVVVVLSFWFNSHIAFRFYKIGS